MESGSSHSVIGAGRRWWRPATVPRLTPGQFGTWLPSRSDSAEMVLAHGGSTDQRSAANGVRPRLGATDAALRRGATTNTGGDTMDEQRIERSTRSAMTRPTRRAVLRGLGGGSIAAALGTGLVARAGAQDGEPGMHPIVGTWRVFLGDAPGIHGLVSHGAGGTLIGADPPVASPPPGMPVRALHISPGLGVWEAAGEDRAAVTFQQLVTDENGTLLSIVTVSGVRQLSADGKSFTTPYAYVAADPHGNVLDSGTGTVRGERMAVEPMEALATLAAGTPAP